MKSTLMRISLILLFLLPTSSILAAESKTFIREYSYQASELDSKVSCRVIALEQVKRLLLEEAGTYLESETEVRNYRLTKDQITILTAGVVRTELLNEKWDGKTYYIQARLAINPKEVGQSIDKLRQDKQKTKELEESKKKVNELLQKIDELKKKVPSTKVTQSKSIPYMKAVDKLRAIELCERATSLRLSNPLTFKTEEAIELYSEAIALDQNFIDPYYWRANQYAYEGIKVNYINNDQALTFYRKALKDYDKIVHLKPQNYFYAWALSGRGDVYQQLGDYKRAIKDYSEAIRRERKNAKHYDGRSESYKSIGEYEKAIADITKAIELTSNYPEFNWTSSIVNESRILNRADIASKAKMYKEAVADYSMIIRNMESSKKDYLIDKFWSSREGDFEKIKLSAIENKKNDQCKLSNIYFNRGHVYATLGIQKKAIFDFTKSIDICRNVLALLGRGKLHVDEDKYALAVNDYSSAIEMNATMADAYHGRGYARIKLGQREQGIEDMKIAAKLNFKPAQDHLISKGIPWK